MKTFSSIVRQIQKLFQATTSTMTYLNTCFMIILTTLTVIDYAVHQNISTLIILASMNSVILVLNFLTPLFSIPTHQHKNRIQKLEQEVSRLKTAFNLKDWEA